jgi:hypothetical protein
MILCAVGDIHGAIDHMYEDVLAFEEALGVRFAWVLHVGDFGIWPDPDRIDKATRKHEGAGDFPRWLAERRSAPRPTAFIKGNHEDFDWLDAQPKSEILPGMFHVRNAGTIDLRGEDGAVLRVAGMGGCFGPSDYERKAAGLDGYAKRHYTRDEVERLAATGRVDVLLLHDAPAGVRFKGYGRRSDWVSEAAGLGELVARVRPRVCFFGHHHRRVDADVSGVRCIGLNLVRRPGNLVAIEMAPRGRDWSVLGEWPRPTQR